MEKRQQEIRPEKLPQKVERGEVEGDIANSSNNYMLSKKKKRRSSVAEITNMLAG